MLNWKCVLNFARHVPMFHSRNTWIIDERNDTCFTLIRLEVLGNCRQYWNLCGKDIEFNDNYSHKLFIGKTDRTITLLDNNLYNNRGHTIFFPHMRINPNLEKISNLLSKFFLYIFYIMRYDWVFCCLKTIQFSVYV